MANSELNRELTSLISEKKMGAAAIKSQQNAISLMLNGYMGKDINDVLSGKKVVKLSLGQKLKYKIKGLFKLIMGENEDEYAI